MVEIIVVDGDLMSSINRYCDVKHELQEQQTCIASLAQRIPQYELPSNQSEARNGCDVGLHV